MIAQLGLLQSNALAGNLGLLAAPGATWVTPAGRVLRVAECGSEPADAAAAGLTWVDAITARPLQQQEQASASGGAAAPAAPAGPPAAADGDSAPAAGQLLLVTYQLWSFKGQARDSSRVRQCSAVLQAVDPAAPDGYKLLHLHEGVMDLAATATGAFEALAAGRSAAAAATV
jgi:hypothetical protein